MKKVCKSLLWGSLIVTISYVVVAFSCMIILIASHRKLGNI